VVFTITMLLFFTMFRLLPSWHAKLKYTIWGTFVTTILFLIGKFLLSIYLSKSEISSYYGAASTLVSMMLWLFYTYQIIFFGAEIIVYLQQRNTDNKIVSGCNKTNILDI
jgi:membrane protein